MQSKVASHVLTANKPADKCLFFSFVLVLFLISPLWFVDHETRSKKSHRKANWANLTEKSWTEWFMVNQSFQYTYLHARIFVVWKVQALLKKKPWIRGISTGRSRAWSWILTLNKAQITLVCGYANFYQTIKRWRKYILHNLSQFVCDE